ncbi:hypothetical protein K9M74_03305 [Candidatus Woesearchaeota archaeon]|nr:hypothetical protein [Candidatus Woesearchaeota archaeon]MCF7859168.1 hypothetical protein [Candidatus Cloacimonadota bacterium]MCF8012811.1 hypothetical protein [Candidatus Woesearchaeota archaeon]
MNEEIKFDEEMVIQGQWTQDQLDLMKSLMDQINKVMSERFPGLADHVSIKYDLPDEGIGAKFTANFNVDEIMYLGDMNQIHNLEVFKEHPKDSEKSLRALFNDMAVLTYYQLLQKAITSALGYVTKRAEEEGMHDQGRFFVKRKKVIPLPFIPEDVVLMHPNTIKNLKRDGR